MVVVKRPEGNFFYRHKPRPDEPVIDTMSPDYIAGFSRGYDTGYITGIGDARKEFRKWLEEASEKYKGVASEDAQS